MIAKIDKPGIYDNIPAEVYHGDLCVGPSISKSIAWDILNTCPAKAFHNCYLNSSREVEQKQEFDVATAAHLVVLEPEKWDSTVVEIACENYKKKEAQEARDRAYNAGKIPLTEPQALRVLAMRTALRASRLAGAAFEGGKSEQTIVWQDEDTGVFLKARPDHWHIGGDTMVDYKTTASADPDDFARRCYDFGHFLQDPWYRSGAENVGKPVKHFWFVVQETTAPFLVSVNKLDDHAIEWGALMSRRAIDEFSNCFHTARWPGYDAKARVVSLPKYAEYQLEERREAGQFERQAPTPEALAAAKLLWAKLDSKGDF